MQNRQQRILTYVLAVACTGVLVLMAGISGFQRGGSGMERWLWVAASCLIVCTVHLLPGLMQGKPLRQNLPMWSVWAGGFVFVIFAHSQFFTLAELHAGQERIATSQGSNPAIHVSAITAPATPSGRSATQVATELSKATALLNRLPEAKQEGQRLVITALQQELKIAQAAEAEANRQQQNQAEKINRLQHDPVAQRLGTLFGVNPEMVMLFASLFMALVLELVAVILWRLALDSHPLVISAPANNSVKADKVNHKEMACVTPSHTTTLLGVTQASNEAAFSLLPSVTPQEYQEGVTPVTNVSPRKIAHADPIFPLLFAAIQRDELKPTVSAIRTFAKVGTERARNLREALIAANCHQHMRS